MSTRRISARFESLKREGRAGLIAYVMADDPDPDIAFEIVKALPAAGADIIELGFPFTDPMADGPSIQRAGLRALKAGGSLKSTLALLKRFRQTDDDTPVILMGYANPIEQMGYEAFADAMNDAGGDGAIVVDLPPEEDAPLRTAFNAHELSIIRLATPTTDDARLTTVLAQAAGFVYYVAVTGVTGGKAVGAEAARNAVARLKAHTDLPIAVGFGVRDAASAASIAAAADAVVVGSAFVDEIARLADAGRAAEAPRAVAAKVRELSEAVRGARQMERA